GADYLHTQRSTPGLLQRLGMPIVSVYNKYLKHFVSQGYPRRAELTITASTTPGFEKRIPLTITSDFILTFIDYVLQLLYDQTKFGPAFGFGAQVCNVELKMLDE